MSDVVAERTTGDTSQVNRSSYQATKPATSESGNRLIIFTGTAICGVAADGDGERSLGVVRIRLNFPLSNTLHFIGSATVAALASVHGDDPEEALFAVDAAQTIVAPATEEAFRTTDFLQMTSTSFSMRRRWAPIRISTALHIRRTFS